MAEVIPIERKSPVFKTSGAAMLEAMAYRQFDGGNAHFHAGIVMRKVFDPIQEMNASIFMRTHLTF